MALAVLGTLLIQGLTTTKEWLSMSVPNQPSPGEHDAIIGLLDHTAQVYEQARQARLQAARTARALGVTYAQIAEAYDITPSAVNMMLRRAEGL